VGNQLKAKCKARAKSKGNPRQYIISQGKVEAKCEAQAQSMPPPHFPPTPNKREDLNQ